MHNINGLAFISLTSLVLLTGCNSKPQPISFGKDVCHYCKMVIADPRYGAELITDKGRIYKYDALECMIAHVHDEATPKYELLLAIAYNHPESLYPVDSLSFVISPDYRSPMGENLAAFYKDDTLKESNMITWTEIYRQISLKKSN